MLKALAIALAALGVAAPAAAATTPHVVVGMGEQNPGLFDDERFLDTGITHARLIVPYNVVKAGSWPLDAAAVWLARARHEGIEPLVTFSRRWGPKKRRYHLPSVREYSKRIAEFRARFPWVR